MGARSFMLATRIPMSRDGFDAWLRTPLPGLGIIENPSAMYAGWAVDGADPDWDMTALAAHYPQAVAGIRADRDKTPSNCSPPAPHGATTCSATVTRRLRSICTTTTARRPAPGPTS